MSGSNGVRRLKQLRDDAPADHHRYLFYLIELFKVGNLPASDLIEMYKEEFDVESR
jgi:hypothetical protein